MLHINLQGLVASVAIGYSVSGTALMYLLLRSNWGKRVEKVQRDTVKEYDTGYTEPVDVLMLEEGPHIKLRHHTQVFSNNEQCVQRVNAAENNTLPNTEELR